MQNSQPKSENNKFKVARIVDSAALASIHESCFEKAWSKEDIISYLRRPTCYALWFEDLAFVLFDIVADEAEIKTIAVLEPYRKQGFAQKLCAEVIAVSQEFAVKKIFLEVSDKNEAAINLYKKLEFKEYNRRENYYNPGEDALLMQLHIG